MNYAIWVCEQEGQKFKKKRRGRKIDTRDDNFTYLGKRPIEFAKPDMA